MATSQHWLIFHERGRLGHTCFLICFFLSAAKGLSLGVSKATMVSIVSFL